MKEKQHMLPSDITRRRLIKVHTATNPHYGKAPDKMSIKELLNTGVINLNKPSGPTSHQVVAWVKKIFEIEKAGHLMNISHDGDRVSRLDEKGDRIKFDNSCHDDILRSHGKRLADGDSSAALHLQPGGYGCSTRLIDEMIDIALTVNGVVGAQLSGAGLGGCIMALVKEESAELFEKTMISSFYEKHTLPPQILISTPIAGSSVISL